jgi:hypothetical protein
MNKSVHGRKKENHLNRVRTDTYPTMTEVFGQ